MSYNEKLSQDIQPVIPSQLQPLVEKSTGIYANEIK